MRLDRDLLRKILFQVEELGNDPGHRIQGFSVPGYDRKVVTYHVWQLGEDQYLRVQQVPEADASGSYFAPICLTPKGHDFLESVRDEEIWNQTKEAARKGGAATIELLVEISKAFLRKQIEQRTGITL